MAYFRNGADYDAWLLRLNDKGQLACGCSGATCDDGNSCTVDACYLGICKGKQVAATTLSKTETSAVGKGDAAGVCISLCGNKYCDSGENNSNCPADCITACGNSICESGENYSNCSKDCKHVCDSSCGGKAPTGCYCDTTCKTEGDCCTGTGYAGTSKTYSCAGSTCASCK
ncbi:MAG: hypothetical protein EXR77_11710 [Myxococcales bacterium]|nr:hypothetical protein [Myxococcales bacterium]